MESNLFDRLLSIPHIQDSIFKDDGISSADLAQFTLVSKTWHKAATPFLWRQLTETEIQSIDPQGLRANVKWTRHLGIDLFQIMDRWNDLQNCTNLSQLDLNVSSLQPHLERTDNELEEDGREVRTETLERLVHQNPQLIGLCCYKTLYDDTGGNFTFSAAKAFVDSCSTSLQSLKLHYISLQSSILSNMLNGCKNLKELSIMSCMYDERDLETFDGELCHLEELEFLDNSIATDALGVKRYSKGRDWITLLASARDSPRFKVLYVGSKVLIPEEMSDLINLQGPSASSLSKVSDLKLSKCLHLDTDLARILAVVHPLNVFSLRNIPFGQESLRIMESRHQNTLEEWTIWGSSQYAPKDGLIGKFQLPKLRVLLCTQGSMSFKVFIPQLYHRRLEEEEEEEEEAESSLVGKGEQTQPTHVLTFGTSPDIQTGELISASEEQLQPRPYDWACPEMEDVNFSFSFDPVIEWEAKDESWNDILQTPEEFFVKAFLLLIDQLARLPKLRYVYLSITSARPMDESSPHWLALDDCWTRFTAHELELFHLCWPVPNWLQVKFEKWHQTTYST